MASSYICYAVAFRQAGPPAWELGYLFSMVFHPFFILGLGLSFGGSLARLGMFHYLGISRTVLVSELTTVLMLVLSFLIFRERLTWQDMGGAVIILVGVWLVGSQ